MLIFVDGSQPPEYVPWTDVARSISTARRRCTRRLTGSGPRHRWRIQDKLPNACAGRRRGGFPGLGFSRSPPPWWFSNARASARAADAPRRPGDLPRAPRVQAVGFVDPRGVPRVSRADRRCLLRRSRRRGPGEPGRGSRVGFPRVLAARPDGPSGRGLLRPCERRRVGRRAVREQRLPARDHRHRILVSAAVDVPLSPPGLVRATHGPGVLARVQRSHHGDRHLAPLADLLPARDRSRAGGVRDAPRRDGRHVLDLLFRPDELRRSACPAAVSGPGSGRPGAVCGPLSRRSSSRSSPCSRSACLSAAGGVPSRGSRPRWPCCAWHPPRRSDRGASATTSRPRPRRRNRTWIYSQITNQSLLGFVLRTTKTRCAGIGCLGNPLFLGTAAALTAITIPLGARLARARQESRARARTKNSRWPCISFWHCCVYPVSQVFYSVLLVPLSAFGLALPGPGRRGGRDDGRACRRRLRPGDVRGRCDDRRGVRRSLGRNRAPRARSGSRERVADEAGSPPPLARSALERVRHFQEQ